MKKTFIQGFLIIVLFLSTWVILKEFDWMTVLRVQKVTDKTEEKLGELFWGIFQKSENVNTNPFVVSAVDSIVNKICSTNGLEEKSIKVHIVEKDEVNAFALPNGHLMLYSGIILASGNQEALSGVISHEIAHIQLNHVIKKLIKEVGLTVLISMSTGNGGSEILKETAKLLSSSAYDRSLEKEADIKAVENLINAKINPEPFADFLNILSENESTAMKYLSWANTHPDSGERADYVIAYSRNKHAKYEPLLAAQTWEKLKENLTE